MISGMSDVHDLLTKISNFIRHPRWLDPLRRDTPNWNMLTSSFDTVSDTETVISTFEALPDPCTVGARYLMIYGILQALYLQQDAVESMVRALEPNTQPIYKIESEPEAEEIRKVRHRAVGHPTLEGNVASKKSPGSQMSHFLVQHSVHKDGFTLMTTFASGLHTFTHVSVAELIGRNRTMVERVLRQIMGKLEAAEMEHRNMFTKEKLADNFPLTTHYLFEKVFEGVDNPTSGDGQIGKGCLDAIAHHVETFKEALKKRGLLNRSSHWEYYLTEIEYPIEELKKYWEGLGSLQDRRAANIFTSFVRDRFQDLQKMAVELDEEYGHDTGTNGKDQ